MSSLVEPGSVAALFECLIPPKFCPRKVMLPEKRNPNSNGARPVHLIITMITWIRSSRLTIKKSLSLCEGRFRAEKEKLKRI